MAWWKKLLSNGYRAKLLPSGHDISDNFSKDNNGAIPPNLLSLANTDSNSTYLRECRERGIKPHPARFPHGLPEFFINFLTDPGDLVVDPFAGSNIAGEVAENLQRRWIAFEIIEEYLEGSKFRFPELYQQLSLAENHEEESKEDEENPDTHLTSSQIALLESKAEYVSSEDVDTVDIMDAILTPQLEELINQKVESGQYNSPEEVLTKALQLLEEYDRKLAELRKGIQAGIEQADRGELTPGTVVFEQLRQRNAQRKRQQER
jgi:putative addiction module CopG family antidote